MVSLRLSSLSRLPPTHVSLWSPLDHKENVLEAILEGNDVTLSPSGPICPASPGEPMKPLKRENHLYIVWFHCFSHKILSRSASNVMYLNVKFKDVKIRTTSCVAAFCQDITHESFY